MKWAEILGIAAGSGGLVTAIWSVVKWASNRKTDKKINEVEAEDKQLESLRKQCDWNARQIDKLNKKIDELYQYIHSLEDERLALMKRNNELELALKIAEYNKCERPDDECIRRLPQRQKCRLRMLLNGTYEACGEEGEEEPDEQEHGHDHGQEHKK